MLYSLRSYYQLYLFSLLLLLTVSKSSTGQGNTVDGNNFGVSAGLHLGFGSHTRSLGLFASGYYFNDFYQVNASAKWTFFFKGLGPLRKGHETQVGLGAVVAFENSTQTPNYFQNLVSNQMGKKYSIGYGYKFYFDNKNTSQRTGIIGLQIGQFDILHENDILATSGSDRFRTAAVYVGYRVDSSRIGINATLWTGNSNSSLAKNVYDTTFARYGYKDLSNTEHGKLSLGLLSIQADQALVYGQNARINLGIDSEKVRNTVQNKMMHDMYFLPKKWVKTKNLHIPMLDENGNPFLFKDEQKLRKTKFYYNAVLNSPTFY